MASRTRYPTIREVHEAGHLLRAWCFRCARGDVIDASIWQRISRRGGPIGMVDARSRFRCKICRSAADVILLPARRPPEKEKSWADEVAAFFHSNRAAHKRRRR